MSGFGAKNRFVEDLNELLLCFGNAMKARKRFLLLFVAFLAFIHFGLNRLRNAFTPLSSLSSPSSGQSQPSLSSSALEMDFYSSLETQLPMHKKKKNVNKDGLALMSAGSHGNGCRLSECFDWRLCDANQLRNGLKVHLYGSADRQTADQVLEEQRRNRKSNRAAAAAEVSESFRKVVEIIRDSNYYESNANRACLFMSTVFDTIDRDPLSRDFQKADQSVTSSSSDWPVLANGMNHIVFNLYSGSWPDYSELDFGYGYGYGQQSGQQHSSPIETILRNAILVKASQSYQSYRPDFDVSLPLFARNHPTRGPQFVSHESRDNYLPTMSENWNHEKSIEYRQRGGGMEASGPRERKRKYLLVFKGKRYIYGIGSETRNALHYLDNGRDVLILTTCRHGKKWREMKDQKCDHDNQQYDQHDYRELMRNSTFCLVPRGRRLGSYRFLEALELGCIPVIASNSWVLPFKEIIDWNACAVSADERLLLQIPEQLRSIGPTRLHRMRHKCQSLYETYFSSVERIVLTSLAIIDQRIRSELARQHFVWNLAQHSSSAALVSHLQLIGLSSLSSLSSLSCPALSMWPDRTSGKEGYTAVIQVSEAQQLSSANLQKFFQKSLLLSPSLRSIIILWSITTSGSDSSAAGVPVPQYLVRSHLVRIVRAQAPEQQQKRREKDVERDQLLNRSLIAVKFNANLIASESIATDAVFQLAPNSLLSAQELEFAYSVWQSFPTRIVGFSARDHKYNEEKHVFEYSSKWTNQYSMVLMDAAIYHKVYNNLFTNYFLNSYANSANQWPFSQWTTAELDNECADLAFAFLISHITREGALKISQRKRTQSQSTSSSSSSDSWLKFTERRLCFERLQQTFGYLPLVQSRVRFDPLLYKDLVSIRRKKFRKLENF